LFFLCVFFFCKNSARSSLSPVVVCAATFRVKICGIGSEKSTSLVFLTFWPCPPFSHFFFIRTNQTIFFFSLVFFMRMRPLHFSTKPFYLPLLFLFAHHQFHLGSFSRSYLCPFYWESGAFFPVIGQGNVATVIRPHRPGVQALLLFFAYVPLPFCIPLQAVQVSSPLHCEVCRFFANGLGQAVMFSHCSFLGPSCVLNWFL